MAVIQPQTFATDAANEELVAVMDWATRQVLSWRLSNTMDTAFCTEVNRPGFAGGCLV